MTQVHLPRFIILDMEGMMPSNRQLFHLQPIKTYSNLSLDNFKQFKNINVISHFPAIIDDWKLSFSLCYPTKAFANIHYSKDDCVHGVVMKLQKKDLERLSKLERSYRLKILKARVYKHVKQENKLINVYTFIFDKQCEKRIQTEIARDKNMKQVMRFFDPNGGGKRPEKNYLDTIIRGANELKLDADYIKFLDTFESIPILKLDPTKEQYERINGKIWNRKEIQKFKKDNPRECISILKGIVFDMNQYPPSWKQFANGNDITMAYANRWAYANKYNCRSIESLETDQKLYINGEVQKLLNGIYNVRILGKMDPKTYKYAYDNYSW